MFKTISKTIALGSILSLFMPSALHSQTKYTEGPILKSDKNNNFNRMLGGDESAFYCYRVRSRGKGTSFYVEKYSKSTMGLEFSKEVNLGDDESDTKIVDVEYAAGNVFVFRRIYDKKKDEMTLFFQTISSGGQIGKELKEVAVIKTDHYEFVDFEIFPNPSKTKFLVKAAFKSSKEDTYKTDLILIDAASVKKLSSRRIEQNLHIYNSPFAFSFFGIGEQESSRVIGMYLADNDDIYACVNEPIKEDKEKRKQLKFYTLKAGETKPKSVNLNFDDSYFVGDVEFEVAKDNDVVVGGFLSDVVERRGRDLVKRGIFSFKINVTSNTVTGKTTKFFDDRMLAALESTPKKSKYDFYKMDYIIPHGDATYYVGELYRETIVSSTNQYGQSSSTKYNYEYMDVIVAKLNSQGVFEWIVNSPLRNEITIPFSHVFKQYIAYSTEKSLYILCNDHPKNMARYEKEDFEPADLKTVTGIHGSNFVCNAINLKSGAIKRSLVFKNEEFCFAPIQERNPAFVPPSDCEIFIPGKKGEIFVYTEDAGVDRFGRLELE